jgi:hypothetical protein
MRGTHTFTRRKSGLSIGWIQEGYRKEAPRMHRGSISEALTQCSDRSATEAGIKNQRGKKKNEGGRIRWQK